MTRGLSVIVDDEDFEWLSRYRWVAAEGKRKCFYAQTRWPVGKDVSGKTLYKTREMQRIILDPENIAPRNLLADHINHDTCDNRRLNLRWASYGQNATNQAVTRNKTGYRGVFFDKGMYYVQLRSRGKLYMRHWIDTPEEAAAIYNELAIIHHGDYATLNSISPGIA